MNLKLLEGWHCLEKQQHSGTLLRVVKPPSVRVVQPWSVFAGNSHTIPGTQRHDVILSSIQPKVVFLVGGLHSPLGQVSSVEFLKYEALIVIADAVLVGWRLLNLS